MNQAELRETFACYIDTSLAPSEQHKSLYKQEMFRRYCQYNILCKIELMFKQITKDDIYMYWLYRKKVQLIVLLFNVFVVCCDATMLHTNYVIAEVTQCVKIKRSKVHTQRLRMIISIDSSSKPWPCSCYQDLFFLKYQNDELIEEDCV